MTQTANLGKRKKGLDRMKTAMEKTGIANKPHPLEALSEIEM